MPPMPNVPNVIKFAVNFADGTMPSTVIFHMAYTGGPPTPSNLAAMCPPFTINLMNGVGPHYQTTFQLNNVEATDLTSPTSAQSLYVANTFGTATTAPSPAQASLLLHKTISRRYRGGHPRTYMPGPVAASQATPTTWASGTVSDFAAAWILAISDMTVSGPYGSTTLTHEVSVSYRSGNAPRVVPVVDQIVAVTAETLMATQRRRLQR